MKEIDYKQLRKYANLPTYDIGTRPIGSGYLRNADQTQAGYFTQNAERVTNAFVPLAISSGLQNVMTPLSTVGKNAISAISAYNNVFKNIGTGYGKLAAQLIGKDALSDVYQEGLLTVKASTAAAKSAASKALGAANIIANAYSALHGGYNLINNWKDSDTLTAGDLSNMAARSTEYTNGVAYDRMGGYDTAGVDKYVSDQNKASKIEGVTSGFEAGAGIGGLVGLIGGPFGSLIGSGIGSVVGAIGGLIGGHHAREKRKRAIAEATRNYAMAADAYNTQSESEAASTGLRNQYYATHADKGLSVDAGNPNGLVQGGEPIVKVDKNGRIISADMFPITPWTPERVDNIPVRLDKGSTRDGVIGNLEDPYTGERLAVEGRPLVNLLNAPGATKEEREQAKLGLKELLRRQDMAKNTSPRYNRGGRLPKYDTGTWGNAWLPITNYLLNFADNATRRKLVEREPILVNESYAPNPYLTQAGALMPATVNVSAEEQAANDQARMANYAINQSAYSPGQRMAMLSKLYNDVIKNRTAIAASKTGRENAMRQQYALWLSQAGEAEAGRKQQSRQLYNRDKQQAYAQKRLLLDTIAKDKRGDRNSFFENLFNLYWGNKNIGLYEQLLNNEEKDLLNKLGKGNTSTKGSTYTRFAPIVFNPSVTMDPSKYFSRMFNYNLRGK